MKENRQEFHIEKALRKGWSKQGVLGKLSDMNMREHWWEHDKCKVLLSKIDEIFDKILSEDTHVVERLKGKSKSEFLRLKNQYEKP